MSRLLVIFLLLFSWSLSAGAANVAGQVVLSVGKNVAQVPNQAERFLKRKSDIYASDHISTGTQGRLQIRFSDNSRLSLSPDTQFQVEEYQFTSAEPGEGHSVYRLIRGGLRTITGEIADANVLNYEVNTPIATIGVRGTHYSLFFCDLGCSETTGAKLGLYGYVLEGGISLETGVIKAPISSGQYFYLEKSDSKPEIQQKPFELFEKLDKEGLDLMGAETGSIPALDVNQQPLQGPIQDVTLPGRSQSPKELP